MKKMIDVRPLISSGEINLARNLVYQDYFINRNWFPTNNRSGLRIEQVENLKVFTDDYDKVATWFGAYLAGEIIGCCRLCKRLNGKFELERYHFLPENIRQDIQVNEFNRYATHEKFTNDPMVFIKLVEFIIEYALQSNISIFSTTGINSIARYKDLGFEQCDITPFKFSETDNNYVHIVYTSNEVEKKKEFIKRCAKFIESYQQGAIPKNAA